MSRFNPPVICSLTRRGVMLGGISAVAPAWVGAQASRVKGAQARHAKPMTAAEESAAAKAVAASVADETGEQVHPAVGMSPRLKTSIKLLDGQDFSEDQIRGKLLFVFYWASWCPVCKVVAPRLHEFWQKNRAKGVEVLALSTDTEVQPAFAYMQRTGYKYPMSMASAAQLDGFMAPRSLPTLMVRSKLGVIVNVEEGDIDQQELKEFLVHL
jgi:thiol-disulfide isomerase/thioredoxin